MGKVLEALVLGNIQVGANNAIERPEYQTIRASTQKTAQAISEILPPEYQELFRKFENEISDTGTIEANEMFCQGFRLGSLLLAEVFLERDMILMKTE